MGKEKQLDKVNNSHKNRNYPRSTMGWYIGYHCFIEKDGNKIFLKRDWELGAHTYGHNEHGLGVCLAGNFKLEKPTRKQIRSLKKVINMWKSLYNIPDENVKLHWEVRPTSCPGVDLRLLLNSPKNGILRRTGVRRMSERVLSRLLRRLSRRGDRKRFWRVKKHADT